MKRIIYLSSNGAIHDYRFLSKLVNDYEVLFLHYSGRKIIEEIISLKKLKIITEKPIPHFFPLINKYKHFKSVVKDFNPDLIHSGFLWQVGILPALINYHPHLSMVWGSDILTQPDKSFIIKKIVRKVVNQADHIQCDAEHVKNKILNDYNIKDDKVTVFPWGIDLKIFKPLDKYECRRTINIDNGKFVIIYNRHFESLYGLNYLLEGYLQFAKNKTDIELILLGQGSMLGYIEKFISANDLQGKIRILKPVQNKDLPIYLNASDVYISPSLSDGASLSLLEAMAIGIPIIVSNLEAIMELINESNGILVNRKNSKDITAAFEKIYTNFGFYENLSLQNIEIANDKADWDKNYLKLQNIYSKLI